MGGGGGILPAIADVVTQVSTGGFAGVDEGGFSKGVVVDTAEKGAETVKSTLKDVTGATAAEEANIQARERFEEEKSRAQQQRDEAKADTARRQIIASKLARTARRSGTQKTPGTNVAKLGSDEVDFLGL